MVTDKKKKADANTYKKQKSVQIRPIRVISVPKKSV